jgi:hypothetical protein
MANTKTFPSTAMLPAQRLQKNLAPKICINVDEDYERRHWAKQFGVTENELIDVVKRAGPLVANVTVFLGRCPSAAVVKNGPWRKRNAAQALVASG